MKNSKFYEIIKIRDGEFLNVDNHTKRFNQTRNEIYGECEQVCLWNEIEEKLLYDPQFFDMILKEPIVKLTVTYDMNIRSFKPEVFQIPNFKSLKIVNGNSIKYTHKEVNKKQINLLRIYKGNCDEILIERDGLITDTCCCNVAFFDGNQWFTPANPMIKGTKRAELLEQGKIIEKDISVSELSRYKKVRMFNSMIDFEDKLEIPISKIEIHIQN